LTEKSKIALFDIDGVLLHSGGYRKAFQASMEYFLGQMDLKHLIPDENIAQLFDSYGVICEWDMIPFCLLTIFDCVTKTGVDIGSGDLQETISCLKHLDLKKLIVDYQSYINTAGPYFYEEPTPSKSILGRYLLGMPPCFFPNLKGEKLVTSLLGDTRRIDGSITTQVFENFALGDEIFSTSFGIRGDIAPVSYLEAHDISLLDPDVRELLIKKNQSGDLHLAALTARPSNPPVEKLGEELLLKASAFAPEAEMAFAMLDIPAMPVIGYGKLYYCALQNGLQVDKLIKPSSFHALAAILAAWFKAEWPALELARSIINDGQKIDQHSVKSLPRLFEVHVFEDSFIGIKACIGAVNILRNLGYQIDFFPWGIATESNKTKALASYGATIFSNVNEAVCHALITDCKAPKN
jgi:hypothetical protein